MVGGVDRREVLSVSCSLLYLFPGGGGMGEQLQEKRRS